MVELWRLYCILLPELAVLVSVHVYLHAITITTGSDYQEGDILIHYASVGPTVYSNLGRALFGYLSQCSI